MNEIEERDQWMGAAAEPFLMTVEQYRLIPDREDVIQELHWGHVTTVTRPKARHVKVQSRLARLLRPKAEHLGYVAPALVIEVLSRSNTTAKLQALAVLCFSGGTEELWVIDPKAKTVTVTSRQGSTVVYRGTDQIPLHLFGGELSVAEIFGR